MIRSSAKVRVLLPDPVLPTTPTCQTRILQREALQFIWSCGFFQLYFLSAVDRSGQAIQRQIETLTIPGLIVGEGEVAEVGPFRGRPMIGYDCRCLNAKKVFEKFIANAWIDARTRKLFYSSSFFTFVIYFEATKY